MANFTYTVLYMDSEVSAAEGESFEYARETALGEVSDMYARDELMFIATCDSHVVGQISGPCYL